jgi:carboxylesterase type B
MQGGGFGINSNPNVNTSGIILAADLDLIVVAINYRVGPFGFLTNGDEVVPNIGLRDQRKAMEWVQQHIASFGGDPDRVVIGGTSAGAASAVFHLLAGNGTDRGLFRGAIGSSPSFATTLTVAQSQYQYNNLATRLGCTGRDSLACLRNKTADEIQEKNFNIPLPGAANPPKYQWLPSIDGDFVTDYPYRSIREGRFVRVPTIWGDDTNGGTVFAPSDAASLADSNQFMLDQYPTLTPAQFADINDMYPNPNASACPSDGCYWRQCANTYQEVRYMCPALHLTAVLAADGLPSYHYLFNAEDPDQIAAGLGVPHTTDLEALLGSDYTDEAPESYKPGGVNGRITPVLQGYWTSFMRTLDPNAHRANGTAEWAPFSGHRAGRRRDCGSECRRQGGAARLVFGTGATTEMVEVDNGLGKRCDYWVQHGLEMLL